MLRLIVLCKKSGMFIFGERMELHDSCKLGFVSKAANHEKVGLKKCALLN